MTRDARGWLRWIAVVSLFLGAAPVLGACGDDGESGPSDAGIDSGLAPRRDAAADSGPPDANLGPCPNAVAPPISPEAFPPCQIEGCLNARCVPNDFVDDAQEPMLADCDTGNQCVPQRFIETSGEFLLATCRSIGGVEGRCASRCLPRIAAIADRLPEEGCNEGEACAPCTDPFTGQSTGVCNLGCDEGPAEEPVVFADCCMDIGTCVPTDLVSESQRASLGADTCAGENLCVPDEFREDGFRPTTCESIGGGEGRCLPRCLPSVAAQGDSLPQSTCPETHRCSPCFNPVTGQETGACRFGGDMPAEEEPFVFPTCCALSETTTRGRCVPPEVVPADRRESLPQDTCAEGQLCIPNPFLADPNHTFASCETDTTAQPGACVPDCIVPEAERLVLGRSTCAEGELCAYCINPVSMEPTGACD